MKLTKAALPDRLTERDQWVCWRQQERDGKQTKVPINPHTGLFGSTTDSDTWSDFETARTTLEDGSVDGVGFVFTTDDPIVGVDLDDCRNSETGVLTDAAASIVTTIDSYTEVSPSGTGVHVLVTGSLPGERNRWDWIECYETARFFTVTGDHVPNTPTSIESRTAALESVYELHQQKATESDETDDDTGSDPAVEPHNSDDAAATGDSGLSDSELLERAREAANSEKFTRLWQGNTAGYDSHSEADMALCALLAFWSAGDRKQIDRLFRKSGLMRPKWDDRHFADGSTYGEKTIDRVVQSTTEYYDPDSDTESSEWQSDWSPTVPQFAEDRDRSYSSGSQGGGDTQSHMFHDNRTQELLEVISDLQAQVERLEKENQQLRHSLAAHEESTDTDQPDSPATNSFVRRLLPW